jgi:hypothetical protein
MLLREQSNRSRDESTLQETNGVIGHMKHPKLAWNFNIRQWFCTTCGRTSDHVSEPDARGELDQYDCQLPYVEAPEPLPGEETARLIKKPYKMVPKID